MDILGHFQNNFGVKIIKKRSVTIGNHRTSISLEDEFWQLLEKEANNMDLSLNKLILAIDNERPYNNYNLSSYIRIWILKKILYK